MLNNVVDRIMDDDSIDVNPITPIFPYNPIVELYKDNEYGLDVHSQVVAILEYDFTTHPLDESMPDQDNDGTDN